MVQSVRALPSRLRKHGNKPLSKYINISKGYYMKRKGLTFGEIGE